MENLDVHLETILNQKLFHEINNWNPVISVRSNSILPLTSSVKSHSVSIYEHIISNHWLMYLKKQS